MYEVLVTNIGNVARNLTKSGAIRVAREYAAQARKGTSRAEFPVWVLDQDGEIVLEIVR